MDTSDNAQPPITIAAQAWDEETLSNKVYVIRGVQVMLDFDLAEIYGYTVSAFNQQVKRNVERFEGEDFMFRLTKDEMFWLSKSQNVISIQIEGMKGGRSKPVSALPSRESTC